MHIIWMLVVGLVAGALAKLIMPGKDPGGIIVTMLLGVVGSFVGGLIGRAVGLEREGTIATIVTAVVGSLVLLGIYRLVLGRRHRPTTPGPTTGTPIFHR